MKISLSPKELEFKRLTGTAGFSKSFMVRKSWGTPTSRNRPWLPASAANRSFHVPVFDMQITDHCHRSDGGEPTVFFLPLLSPRTYLSQENEQLRRFALFPVRRRCPEQLRRRKPPQILSPAWTAPSPSAAAARRTSGRPRSPSATVGPAPP